MAAVWIDHLECASGKLPARCVVCGRGDEIEFILREMEYRPRWPIAFLGLHLVGWHLIGAVLGFFTERYNRTAFTNLPFCEDHYHYWERRDHRQHLGILIIAVGWLLPMLATFILNNNMRMGTTAISVAVASTAIGLIVIYSLGFKAVHVARIDDTRVRIANVHPDFAAAVESRRKRRER